MKNPFAYLFSGAPLMARMRREPLRYDSEAELLTPFFDDQEEIEAISAEIGASGARRPPSE